MTEQLTGYIVPLVVLAVSVPMILGKVPPNSVYGFRTPKTLSSQDVWYPANRAAGWLMLVAAVISICFNTGLVVDRSGMAARQDGLVDDGRDHDSACDEYRCVLHLPATALRREENTARPPPGRERRSGRTVPTAS